MDTNELIELLHRLLKEPQENECLEFKANNGDKEVIGKLISALSNSACVNYQPFAYLIYGIEDETRKIIGTTFHPKAEKVGNANLENWLDQHLNPKIEFKIYEFNYDSNRSISIFIIPATKNIPVEFSHKAYIRVGSYCKFLNEYPEKARKIWSNNTHFDWSAEIVPDATLDDLDANAIALARKNYFQKFPDQSEENHNWDTITFLNKIKLTIKGKITRAALILLGKNESDYLLKPAEVKILWKLIDTNNSDVDYEIFGIPLLLSVEKVFAKIRNLTYRYMQVGTIFPEEVAKYEAFSIREAINNCIAHQDYTKNTRINVIEMPDKLVFTNHGSFIPGNIEKVINDDAPEEYYRNLYLANAMFRLKMVDTAGGGIKKIFNFQRDRFFPMPDYDLSDEKVKLTIHGKIIDIEYAKTLANNKDLTLNEIILLDKVQKKLSISKEEEKILKSKKLIEGRRPNFYIGIKIAQTTNQKAEYSKQKGLNKQYYLEFIINSITQHGELTRKEIDALIWNKLPEVLTDEQKKIKISHLIAELRRENKIKNTGSRSYPKWVLC